MTVTVNNELKAETGIHSFNQQAALENTNKPTLHRSSSVERIAQRLSGSKIPVDNVNFASEDLVNGYPTKEALATILTKYYPSLENAIVKESSGGSNTGKIFSVYPKKTPKKPILFLKINRTGKDSDNLRKIQKSAVGRLGTKHMGNMNFPIIMSVERFLTFDDKTIEITNSARGLPAIDLLNDKEHAEDCASAIGTTLANYHLAFMKFVDPKNPKTWRTAIHGDFHPGNVFFHKAKEFSRVYFIDTETIAKSLDKPELINFDLFRFVFQSLFFWGWLVDKDETQWKTITAAYRSFIKSYINAYPEDKRTYISSYIHDLINKKIDFALKVVKDEKTLKGEENDDLFEEISKFQQEEQHPLIAFCDSIQGLKNPTKAKAIEKILKEFKKQLDAIGE